MSKVNDKGSQQFGGTTPKCSDKDLLEAKCTESETDAHDSRIHAEIASLMQALDEARDEAQKNRDGWQRANATVDRLKSEIGRLEAKLASYEKSSEFASFQKVESLLPVIDDLDRAFLTVPEEIAKSEWLTGLTLIRNNFAKALLDKIQLDKVMLSTEDLNQLRPDKSGWDKMFIHNNDLRDKLLKDFKEASDKMLENQRQILENMTSTEFGFSTIDPTGEEFDPRFHQAVGIDDNDEFESGYVTATVQKGYRVGNSVLRPALVRVAQ